VSSLKFLLNGESEANEVTFEMSMSRVHSPVKVSEIAQKNLNISSKLLGKAVNTSGLDCSKFGFCSYSDALDGLYGDHFLEAFDWL